MFLRQKTWVPLESAAAKVIIVNAMVVTWLTDWSLSNDGKSHSPAMKGKRQKQRWEGAEYHSMMKYFIHYILMSGFEAIMS